MNKIVRMIPVFLVSLIISGCDGRRDFPPLIESEVVLDNTEVFLFPGDTTKITPSFYPGNIKPGMEYEWEVEDSDLVDYTVVEGYAVLLTSKNTGETTIRIVAQENDTVSAAAHLIVKSSDPVDITNRGTLQVSAESGDGSNGSEGSSKVVDGDYDSKFLISGFPDIAPLKLTLEFENPELVNMYSLTSGNDAPARDPKDWVLSGSNNLEDWEVLDERKNQDFVERNSTRNFTFANGTEYRYYQLSILDNNGDGLFQMSEWQLFSFPD